MEVIISLTLFVESWLEWEQVKKPKVSSVVYFNCHHLWVFMLGSHSLSLSSALSHKALKHLKRVCVDCARVHVETDFTRLSSLEIRSGINKCMCIGIKCMTL